VAFLGATAKTLGSVLSVQDVLFFSWSPFIVVHYPPLLNCVNAIKRDSKPRSKKRN
jgi:hypothetical protein